MKNETLVCKGCGSADSIQIRVWQYTNSGEFASDCSDDSGDRWCEDCEEHVDFITKEEYEKK
jgi:hypothetical protein